MEQALPKLYYSEASPFARKNRIVIREIGLESEVEEVIAAPRTQPAELITHNPLSRVPTLVLPDGTAITESRLINEYLDTIGDAPPLLPFKWEDRFEVIRREAFCDGILDFALRGVMENGKEHKDETTIKRSKDTIYRALPTLAQWSTTPCKSEMGDISLDTIAIFAILDYLNLRFADINWREEEPTLASFYDKHKDRTSFAETSPI